jgi:hypothetical protein
VFTALAKQPFLGLLVCAVDSTVGNCRLVALTQEGCEFNSQQGQYSVTHVIFHPKYMYASASKCIWLWLSYIETSVCNLLHFVGNCHFYAVNSTVGNYRFRAQLAEGIGLSQRKVASISLFGTQVYNYMVLKHIRLWYSLWLM